MGRVCARTRDGSAHSTRTPLPQNRLFAFLARKQGCSSGLPDADCPSGHQEGHHNDHCKRPTASSTSTPCNNPTQGTPTHFSSQGTPKAPASCSHEHLSGVSTTNPQLDARGGPDPTSRQPTPPCSPCTATQRKIKRAGNNAWGRRKGREGGAGSEHHVPRGGARHEKTAGTCVRGGTLTASVASASWSTTTNERETGRKQNSTYSDAPAGGRAKRCPQHL